MLVDALTTMEHFEDTRYDIVVMLQPTSPLRQPEHVAATIEMLVEGSWDAVWTVSETDSKSHPLKQLIVRAGRLGYYDPRGAVVVARQQLKPVYHRNGVAYAFTRECLLEQKTIMGARRGAGSRRPFPERRHRMGSRAGGIHLQARGGRSSLGDRFEMKISPVGDFRNDTCCVSRFEGGETATAVRGYTLDPCGPRGHVDECGTGSGTDGTAMSDGPSRL